MDYNVRDRFAAGGASGFKPECVGQPDVLEMDSPRISRVCSVP